MLITPTGIPYEKLTEDKIVFIDADGQHEQGKLPSSEWRFHQAAYQTRPDAQAVVHNHAVHCTAVSILNLAHPGHSLYDRRGRAGIRSPARPMPPSAPANCLSMSRWR